MTEERLGQIKNGQLYKLLDAAVSSTEGNMFSGDDGAGTPKNILERMDAIAGVIKQKRHRHIIETGTNKAFFRLFCAEYCQVEAYRSFGNDPESKAAADIANQHGLHMEFVEGDTNETFTKEKAEGFDLAWIDGGHSYGTCSRDLKVSIEAGVPTILVDDYDFEEVRKAFEEMFFKTVGWAFGRIHPCIGLIQKIGQ